MNPASTPRVHGRGGPVQLGSALGKGGEGAVYEVPGHSVVAKLYHQPLSAEKLAKLEAMVEMNRDRLTPFMAWPQDILRDSAGEARGLLMPRVVDHKDIHTLYSPRSRKALFPSASWRFLLRAASNTARAFAALHETGCVIGDVNHGGVTVSPQATVMLIDCDSFQITHAGRQFLCEVGVPTFTPPELQGRPFRGVIRSSNHDNFGLSVLIFHLLFMGRHPFAGRYSGRGEMPIEKAIEEFRFAYGTNSVALLMQPPPNMPPLDIASSRLARMWEQAFSRDAAMVRNRPTASEWVEALDQLEKQVKVCASNASHHHLDSLKDCPWCRLEAATGALLFNIAVDFSPAPEAFDVKEYWARITGITAPGPAHALVPPGGAALPQPSPEARAKRRGVLWRKSIVAVGCMAALCAAFGFSSKLWFLWLLGAWMMWGSLARWATASLGLDAFQAEVDQAQAQAQALRAQWDRDASDQRFVDHYRQLQETRDKLGDLPRLRQQRLQRLEQEREKQQLRQYLERKEIKHANIRGVGPSRKASLASFGIETAWDVTQGAVGNVPGFGSTLTSTMLAWRREHERHFRFNPGQGVDPQARATLDGELAVNRQQLEQRLRIGPQELEQLRTTILAHRQALHQQWEGVCARLGQAEANLQAVQR